MLNRIKEFLDNRPDPISGTGQTTPYRFWQDTGIGRDTAYRMYNDPAYIPTSGALNKICEAYRIQPGDFLIWKPDSLSQDMVSEKEFSDLTSKQIQKTTKPNQSKKSGRASLIHVVAEVPMSA